MFTIEEFERVEFDVCMRFPLRKLFPALLNIRVLNSVGECERKRIISVCENLFSFDPTTVSTE